MSGRIEAVVFDVGGVLFRWDMRCLLRKLYASEEEAQWAYENVVSLEWHFEHDCGRDLDEMVAERVAEFPAHAHAVIAYKERFLETIPGRVAGTAELVEELAVRGVPLFAITNFPDRFWDEFVPTAPVTRHFRDVVVSGKVKLAKPDPAIFRLAETRLGHPAGAMLFIDDTARNIEAARACGWQAHHFTGADGLAAELRQRGLLG